MNRCRSLFGVVIACVLSACAMCALGASSASALTWHECMEKVGTPEGNGYTNAECSETASSPGGKFHWVPIEEPMTARPTSTGNFNLTATVGGVKFKIVCTGLTGTASAKNEEVGGVMGVSGTGVAEYSGCTVTEPSGKGCTVANPIKTVELAFTTKEMSFVYNPKSGETFTTIVVSGCSVTALNGEKLVKGTAVASVEAPSTGTNMGTGPTTQTFSTTSGSTLTFGGQSATLTGALHYATTEEGPKVAALTP